MPHTKQQLQQLLASIDARPRHHWGQNFLIDLNLMRLLVDAAQLTGRETVLEVGCGTGSLTQLLADHAHAVIAVEIDPQLALLARTQLTDHPNVSIINKDALIQKSALDPEILTQIAQSRYDHPGPFLLIANLPYQIAAPLIINLLLSSAPPDGIFVTVQAEVAQRIIAQPPAKTYGLLSILMQASGSVRLIRKLKPQAFWPMPQVNSAMIAWRRDQSKLDHLGDLNQLRQIVGLFLSHRRKTIKTCLAQAPQTPDLTPLLQQAEIDPNARGETIPVEKYVQLTQSLRNV